ncbi:MAG: glycoside hydrolase family 19 protein [Beijerinckiaceae bacterium]
MLDRKAFFDRIRDPLFGGRISRSQADGIRAILDRWDAERAMTDRRWLAYMLATAHHETARTMQPIRERGGQAYFMRMYDVTGGRAELARRMGNTRPGDGERYSGRGYVQLTWKANYRLAGEKLGEDLVGHPDLAMRPDIAARIMFAGMAEGWFTGRRLADHFAGAKADWRGARRIINGLDQADLIKGYALAYDAALARAQSQPSAAAAAFRSASSAKAHGPSATNSAPVPASAPIASGPAA